MACFSGGNFILGGLVLEEQKYIDFGLELTRSCRETYVQMPTGLGPELFQWQDNGTALDALNNQGPPDHLAEQQYNLSGFWVINGQYALRPEVIESYYHAYRATGDPKYQEWAWEAFVKINQTCSVGSGFSAILDVNSNVTRFFDFQESFWFAEVLKYCYLIFDDGNDAALADVHVDGDGKNKFVYNTEAHPVRVFRSGLA